MQGIQVSQARAHELSDRCEAFLSSSTGFWIRTDNVNSEFYTYRIYVTGDVIQEIPEDAFRFVFEITLTEAATIYDIPYSTMAAWAREGKLDARKSAGIWLTTHRALKAITK